jgi:hypothetical protein
MQRETLPFAILGAALVGWIAATRRTDKGPIMPSAPRPGSPEDAKPPEPIAVGDPESPEIAALLDEMNRFFRSRGIDTTKASAREVTILPRSPLGHAAIPPRAYWPRMANTIANFLLPLRARLGIPLRLSGYRPPEYNATVSGSPRSRHMWFEALDVRPIPYTGDERRRLALEAARLHNERGASLKAGLGVYGPITPSNIHIDTGWKARTWRDAAAWKAKAR